MGDASVKPVVRPADDETTVMQEISILLRDGRLDQGESVEDIASALRINSRYIEALEEGRFGDLPGPAYTLGFIRSFGAYVGLDGEELVRRFKAVSSTAAKRAELEFPEPIPESGIPGGVTLFAGLLVAALAYGGWYFMSEKDSTLTDLVAPVPNELVDQTGGASLGTGTAPATRMAESPEADRAAQASSGQTPYAAGSESAQGEATGEATGATTVTGPSAEPSGEVAAESSTGAVGGATDEAAGAAADESGTTTANTAETTTTETVDTATGQGAESTESTGSSTQAAQETTQEAALTETQTGDQAQTATTDATSATGDRTASAQTAVETAPKATPEPAAETPTKTIPEPVAKPAVEPVIEPAAEPAASASVDTSAEPASETPSVTSSVTQTDTQEAQAGTKSTTASETASTEDLNRQQLTTMQGREGSSGDAEAGTSAQSSASSAQSSAEQTAEQSDRQTGEQATTSDTKQTAEQSTTEQAPAEQGQATDDTASSAPGLSAEEVQASADAILLIAREDAWVEVRNTITGDILLSRTLRKGQNFRVPANGQYVLQTGNAGALRVVIDGKVTPPIGKDGEILRRLALRSESLLKK